MDKQNKVKFDFKTLSHYFFVISRDLIDILKSQTYTPSLNYDNIMIDDE